MQVREYQARANSLLNHLDSSELATIVQQSTLVTCDAGDMLHEARQPLDHGYFPLRGMVSIFVVANNGKTIETGFVSSTGGLCHPHQDRDDIPVRLVANTAGAMLKTPLSMVWLTMQQNHAFRDSIILHQSRMIYLSHLTTMCVALHSLRERVCLWLLLAAAHSPHDRVNVTQHRMSQHLGVDRARVNGVLQDLQKREIVALARRGEIWILDRFRLRELACDCHEAFTGALDPTVSGVESNG